MNMRLTGLQLLFSPNNMEQLKETVEFIALINNSKYISILEAALATLGCIIMYFF